jgi:hypothetical protein
MDVLETWKTGAKRYKNGLISISYFILFMAVFSIGILITDHRGNVRKDQQNYSEDNVLSSTSEAQSMDLHDDLFPWVPWLDDNEVSHITLEDGYSLRERSTFTLPKELCVVLPKNAVFTVLEDAALFISGAFINEGIIANDGEIRIFKNTNLTIASEGILTISKDATLVITKDGRLYNFGTIVNEGTIVNKGKVIFGRNAILKGDGKIKASEDKRKGPNIRSSDKVYEKL